MLIGIDGNEANIKERVGVNVWAFELLKGLRRIRGNRGIRWIMYLSKPPIEDLPKETENWKYRVIGPGKFWTRWRLPLDLYLHKPRPDVFLSLSHYAPKWSPTPRVVCIMDLSFLKYPEAFKPAVLWQLKNWTREFVGNAAHIITISEFNKKEIVKEYGIPEDKITVVYPGVGENFINFQRPKAKGRRPKENPYLLFVGTRQPKKNLGRLIEAFGIVRKDFPEVELVVAGKTWGQFTGEKAEGRRPKAEGITYLGYVAEKELPELVARAEALVLPSLYEGFGIPAAEAMSVGTLVAASNTTSLPEVAGNSGILFNPLDVKDMAEKIGLGLSMDKNQKRELIEKGMIRAKRFSWDKAADKIIKVLYER